MKIKTIKKVLCSKFNEWANSITDDAVRELVIKNSIITGGAIASMLMREQVNDYDIYFRNRETCLAVAKYYVALFKAHAEKQRGVECPIYVNEDDADRIKIVIKSAGVANVEGSEQPYRYFESRPEQEAGKYIESIIQSPGGIEDRYTESEDTALANDEKGEDGKPKYRPVFMSTNAITLSNRVQIVIRFYGEPSAIHDNYDFVHCTNFWSSWDEQLVLRQAALESLMTKELRYIGSKYPVCSVIRLRKFIARQWTINAGQIIKMIMQINELDLLDIEVLRDQLTGVDSAYFAEVIQKLSDKDPEKVNFSYLMEIIDRIF
jgi:hypothetical protein